MTQLSGESVEKVEVAAYTIPTDAPEGDGTLQWDSTTLVVCWLTSGGRIGLGYTYGEQATAAVANKLASKCLVGQSPFDIPARHAAMLQQVRNDGTRGIASMAISALDVALWDLKAKLLQLSVLDLLGAAGPSVTAYGSGGFTTYSDERLQQQLSGWAAQGMKHVKMKIGAHPDDDLERVNAAREAIGDDVQLFVDANGAFDSRQAITFAHHFTEYDVTWFEEPVSSDHLADMHLVRERAPDGMEIAAGEYGYDPFYFRRMLQAEAVDVLQLDATRCKGYTGFLQAASIATSFGRPLSAHCAPSLHMHVACAVPGFRNIEYFHDHVRIEQMLFDGFREPVDGQLVPDRSRPGLGLVFKRQDAQQFLVQEFR